tara:strand:+ start:3035 stop:3220 length:186 start_codon:yes stop_codon:yes gene_type:complete
MSDELYDLSLVIQQFLEQKLQAEIHGAGLTVGDMSNNQPGRMADIEVSVGESKYSITIEEL